MELLDIGMCIDIPPINHSSFIFHSPPDTSERTDEMCSVKFGPQTKMTFSFRHVAKAGGAWGL